MPNRLAAASSPYLLQHAENPVDWYEWGDEALAAARERDRPIFLSVGYSACHWCHVMAHESFEDPETASYMNEHFVNVKVDREERPDIDRIYMDAVQAMTGRGGWPMSVFLTPDGRPVLAGTYYPKEAMGNHPSFRRVLEAVNDAWENRRDELDDQADRLTEAVRRRIPPLETPPGAESIDAAVDALAANFDEEHGGFGAAPKFPQAPSLEVLLRALAADGAGPRTPVIERMLRTTLDHMAAGGIYDHLGGGFARYAVDRVWLVPHFEKMLYDNALLARVYLRAWQLLGTERYRDVAVETLDYLLRDMVDDTGGLHAAEDADSEGEEGKFYVWTLDELHDVLGEDANLVARLYGVTEAGNFEGANILHLAATPEQVAETTNATVEEVLAARRRADELLFARRSDRIRPGRDDKVITAWNGLALRALAEAGAVLGSERYLEGAVRVARCALDHLIDSEGRLLRSIRNGRGDVPGFCDDYAALAVGLLTLYQATGDAAWFEAGRDLATDMIELFADADSGGFFATGRDAEALISRPKSHMDNPTPSDNALAAEALQMLHALTGEQALRDRIEGVYRASGRLMAQYPTAVGHLIAVRAVDPPREVAIVGPEPSRRALSDVIWETFRPGIVLAEGDEGNGGVPLLQDRPAGERARAYVCENFVCALPVETPEALREQLE